MKKIAIITTLIISLVLSTCYTTFSSEKYDYQIVLTKCKEVNGNIIVAGNTGLLSEYDLKLTMKDEDEKIVYTDAAKSGTDGEFSFPEFKAPENDKDKTYSIIVEPVHAKTSYSYTFSDSFDSGITAANYALSTTAWDSDKKAVKVDGMADGGKYVRLISDFKGNYSSGEAFISAKIMKTDKTTSSRLFRTLGKNGNGEAYKVKCNSNDIFAITKDGQETLTLVKNYDVDTWYELAAVMDLSTKNIDFYADGELKGTLNYGNYDTDNLSVIYRAFDTSLEAGDGCHYIDDVNVKWGISSKKWIKPAQESVFVYRKSLSEELINSVSEATKDDLWDKLNEFPEILDKDVLKNISNLSDAATLMLSGENTSVDAIRKNYYKSIMVQRIKEKPSDVSIILNEMISMTGIDNSDIDTTDLTFKSVFVKAINSVSTIAEFEDAFSEIVLLMKMTDTNINFNIVEDNKQLLMDKYGLKEEYSFLSTANRKLVVNELSSYQYADEGFEEAIKKITEIMNGKVAHLIKNVPEVKDDYTIQIEQCCAYGNTVTLSGNIGVQAKYDLNISITDGENEVYSALVTTDEYGVFTEKCELPLKSEDCIYNVSISPVNPNIVYTTEFSDNYSTDQTGTYVVFRGCDIDKTIGNEAPSVDITYNVQDSSSPRILLDSNALRNKADGEVIVEADIMKLEKSESDYLLRSMEHKGDYAVYTIKTDSQKIYAETSSGELTIVDEYETNKWYKLRARIELAGKRIMFYVNGVYRGMLSYADKASVIPNVGRPFDSGELKIGNSHYLDNALVISGTYSGEKYWISNAETTVKVYGTNTVNKLLSEINNATKDTLFEKITQNNDVMQINMNMVSAGNVSDKEGVAMLILTKDYTSVSDLRSNFAKAVLVQKLKENPDKISETIAELAGECNIDIKGIDIDSNLFKTIIKTTISQATFLDKFDTIYEQAEIETDLLGSTKLTVANSVDKYATVLMEKYALSKSYSALTSAQKNDASQEIFSEKYDDYASDKLMSVIVDAINSRITEILKEGNNPESNKKTSSGGGGTASVSWGSKTKDTGVSINDNVIKEKFSDVTNNHWAYKPIVYLADIGVLNGKGEDKFAPNDIVTREEFVKILVLANKLTLMEKTDQFNDVPSESWYASYVSTAVAKGIINGISNSMFGSGMGVSREDAAVMLYRANKNKFSSVTDAGNDFADADTISEYASKAINALYSNKAISGMGDGNFMPKKLLTRAEAAQLVFNVIFK